MAPKYFFQYNVCENVKIVLPVYFLAKIDTS